MPQQCSPSVTLLPKWTIPETAINSKTREKEREKRGKNSPELKERKIPKKKKKEKIKEKYWSLGLKLKKTFHLFWILFFSHSVLVKK